MSFSLPRFLRRVQPSDLQGYFSTRAIDFSEPIDWTAHPADFLSSVKAAIEALPERERERVFEDFERIDQLSDDIGQRALHSVIDHNEAFLRQFHSCNGSEARGLFVLLTDEEAFDYALATAYAERMRHGRSWSGFYLPAPLAPSKSPSDIAFLEADLSALFHQFDGTGRKLKIESFERRTADFPGDPCRQIKGGRPLRENIAKSFAHHLLDSETTLAPVSRRNFDLDRLKRPAAFPTDPVDGVKSVVVTLFRLRNTSGCFGRVTIEIDDAERGTSMPRARVGSATPIRCGDLTGRSHRQS